MTDWHNDRDRTNCIYICPSEFGHIKYKAVPNIEQYEPKKPTKPHAAYIGHSPWGRRKKR